MEEKGTLVVSGIMLADKEVVVSELKRNGFNLLTVVEKGNWLAMKCALN